MLHLRCLTGFWKRLLEIYCYYNINQSLSICIFLQKQPLRDVPRKKCSENMQQICRRTPMSKCDFNKVAKQLYWNHTSAWVFSCKFAAYLQSTFSKEHLWVVASVLISNCLIQETINTLLKLQYYDIIINLNEVLTLLNHSKLSDLKLTHQNSLLEWHKFMAQQRKRKKSHEKEKSDAKKRTQRGDFYRSKEYVFADI